MSRFLPLYATIAYLFLHLPLLVLGAFSFNSSRFTVWESFSFHWYRALGADQQLMEAAGNSLLVAIVATTLSTVAGVLCAYALWKRKSRTVVATLSLTLVTPEIVMGISMLALFQWVFRYLHLSLGLHTVILAHVLFCLAYVVVVVLARLRSFDPTLEEAAMDLGANHFQVFRRVTLPLLLPAALAAALLAFTISFDDYVITSMVAGVDSETLPMVLYAMARRGANPAVNAVSTIIVFGLGLLIILAARLQSR